MLRAVRAIRFVPADGTRNRPIVGRLLGWLAGHPLAAAALPVAAIAVLAAGAALGAGAQSPLLPILGVPLLLATTFLAWPAWLPSLVAYVVAAAGVLATDDAAASQQIAALVVWVAVSLLAAAGATHIARVALTARLGAAIAAAPDSAAVEAALAELVDGDVVVGRARGRRRRAAGAGRDRRRRRRGRHLDRRDDARRARRTRSPARWSAGRWPSSRTRRRTMSGAARRPSAATGRRAVLPIDGQGIPALLVLVSRRSHAFGAAAPRRAAAAVRAAGRRGRRPPAAP